MVCGRRVLLVPRACAPVLTGVVLLLLLACLFAGSTCVLPLAQPKVPTNHRRCGRARSGMDNWSTRSYSDSRSYAHEYTNTRTPGDRWRAGTGRLIAAEPQQHGVRQPLLGHEQHHPSLRASGRPPCSRDVCVHTHTCLPRLGDPSLTICARCDHALALCGALWL